LIAGAIILAGAGYLFYVQSKQVKEADQHATNTVDYGPPTKEQEEGGNAITESSDPNNTGSDRPTTPAEEENGKAVVGVTITSPEDQGGSNIIQIRASIIAITGSGTCTLQLTKNSVTVTKQAGVQALPSSSTCKGFDIPASELSPGQWNAVLTFENDTSAGTAMQTVTVR